MSSALTLALAAGRISPAQHRAYAEAVNAGMMLQAHIDILRSEDTMEMLKQVEASLEERERAIGIQQGGGQQITWGRNHKRKKHKPIENDEATEVGFEL